MRSKWGAVRGLPRVLRHMHHSPGSNGGPRVKRVQAESWPSDKLFSRGDPPIQGTQRAGSMTWHIWDIWTWGQRSLAPFAIFVLGTGLGGGESLPLSSFFRADSALLLASTWPLWWPVNLLVPNYRPSDSTGRGWRKRIRPPFSRWEENLFWDSQPGILKPSPSVSCWPRLSLFPGQPPLFTGPQWQCSAV